MKSLRIIVVGTVATSPYAGHAWVHMQLTAGLRRLGHDAYYMEATSTWPYDPIRQAYVNDAEYALPYLAKVTECFGLEDRWAYRKSYSDKEWLGPVRDKAEDLLAHADAVFNVAGATQLRTEEGLKVGRLIYYATDPVYDEIGFALGDKVVRTIIDQHDDIVTIGENIGNASCPLPPLPRFRATTRQPILTDYWQGGPPSKEEFTTICNWKQEGRGVHFEGETYHWSKHYEFLKFVNLPQRVTVPIELAMGLSDARLEGPALGELVPAIGMTQEERSMLASNGWQLVNAHTFTTEPLPYRDYIQSSRGEFSVAKDQNVRLRTGWFSDRSACYLAASRPVIVQDTGFCPFLPTGLGLFAFNTMEDIVVAFDAINSDYKRHSQAARDIAEEFFKAEIILSKLIKDLGL